MTPVLDGITIYLADPVHQELYGAYESAMTSVYLRFNKLWIGTILPPPWSRENNVNPLCVVLLDTTDGKRYETRMGAFYQQQFRDDVDAHLQIYMYAEHHCPCHRKISVSDRVDTDEECEGERFLIERIEAPGLSGLVLYSETMREDELEAILVKKEKKS